MNKQTNNEKIIQSNHINKINQKEENEKIGEKIEYFEKMYLPGDYFELHSLNKNGINLIIFTTEYDSDIIYLNNKKYNQFFLSSINKTEKLRKKFILDTIDSMREMPKLRFDLFYSCVNVEVKIFTYFLNVLKY